MKLVDELQDLSGVVLDAVEPAARENGDALVLGDVWIDISDPDSPEIHLWTGSVWVSVSLGIHTHVESDVTDMTHRQWIGPWTLDNAGA